jgi:hypothetical protein
MSTIEGQSGHNDLMASCLLVTHNRPDRPHERCGVRLFAGFQDMHAIALRLHCG